MLEVLENPHLDEVCDGGRAMEIISRKGGGLPQNYAETNSWLNPDPVRALAVLRMKVMESLEVAAAVQVLTPAIEGPGTTESGGFTMRRNKHRRR
ncbi:MAG TPA: hypothetical protein VF392_10665 [Terracidiphilus sp.]